MFNSLLEDPQHCHAFSNFCTKQNVLKRKLSAEFATKEWNVSASDFGGGSDLTYEKRHNKKVSKCKIDSVPNRIYVEDPITIQNRTRIEYPSLEIDSKDAKVPYRASQNLKKSIEENRSKSNIYVSSKRLGSVFLEVQNLQSSFLKSNCDGVLKPCVKLPSEFSKKFKAEILSRGTRQHKKPESSLYILGNSSIVGQTNPHCKCSFESIENHRVDLSEKTKPHCKCSLNLIENHRVDLLGKTKPQCKRSFEAIENRKVGLSEEKCENFRKVQKAQRKLTSSVKAIPDLKIYTDLISKHVDDIQNIPSSFHDKSIKDAEHSKNTTGFQNRDDLINKLEDKAQNVSNFVPHEKLLKFSDFTNNNKLLEKVKFDISKQEHNKQNELSAFMDDESIKNSELKKEFNTDLTLKKKSEEQSDFQKSFTKHNSVINRPIVHSSKILQNFKSSFFPKRNAIEEQEHVPKKIKVDKSCFIVPSLDVSPSEVACKVKKINISATSFPCPEIKTFASTITKKDEIVAEFSPVTSRRFRHLVHNLVNERSLQDSFNRSEVSFADFSRLLETRSDGSKGSNWMQSLKPVLTEENVEDNEEPTKKIRNIIPGGFAEEMLRLQRRENSEKVIWNHKIHRNKRKAQNNSLCLILSSISCIEEFIVAKAFLATREQSQSVSEIDTDIDDKAALQSSDINFSLMKMNPDASEGPQISNVVFMLFKRKAFSRLQLKVNDVFRVYQPWQTLYLKSVPHPFILCSYFIDILSSPSPGFTIEPEVEAKNPSTGSSKAPELLKNVQPESDTHGDVLFFKRDELVTFSARIQRIWKKEFKVTNPNSSTVATKYIRYSALLQIKEGTFHELRILPNAVPDLWCDAISKGEGKCFLFHNLCVTHRIHLRKDKYLRDILEALHQQNGRLFMQDSCYQLMFDSSSKCPKEIAEEDFPNYCPIKFEPLIHVFKANTCERFTCTAKVLLQYNDMLYVSDESLSNSPSLKYVQVQFLMTAEVRPSLMGSIVLIKEALVEEGCLLLDNYSQLIPIFESSYAYHQLPSSKVKKLANVCLKNVISFLQMCSEEDIVCIKGEITSVDANAALTWLQCSFCFQENLVHDSNLVIYCEDCCRIVPCPILHVKLEVGVHCKGFPSAKVHVQLLSSTIKRILKIPEGTYQPQCTVHDVLGKEIGPLYCFLQSRDAESDKPVFHLSEVCSS